MYSKKRKQLDEIKHSFREYVIKSNLSKITGIELDKYVNDYFSPLRISEQIKEIRRYYNLLRTDNFLEIGCGVGLLVNHLNRKNICNAIGVEPGDEIFNGIYQLSKKYTQYCGNSDNTIINAFGEKLPFNDNSFEIIYSTSVLEHVRSPEEVLKESLRVLKNDGVMIFNFNNYGSWWESHYGMLLFPYCPKKIYIQFLRLIGKEYKFAETLNFITYRKIINWLNNMKENVEIISFGQDLWAERVLNMKISDWASLHKLKYYLKILNSLKLNKVMVFLGKYFHWETPFILVIKKVNSTR